jgi:hypothetical protein
MRLGSISLITILTVTSICLIPGAALSGDRFWSPAPGLSDVNEFAVCGTTVYAAAESGLYRSTGDPEVWTLLRSNYVDQVACAGSKVIWEEIIGVVDTVFVSHNALQTVVPVSGLDGAASTGIRDLAIAGDLALATTLWGVFRSTDGGLNFPSAYPVLWESSGGYQLTAVWTNGAACVAAGSGGFAGQGIWHSPTGDSGTWTLVLNTGGQGWLDGSGSGTIVSGDNYAGALANGYVSDDAGLTWSQLPLNWGGIAGQYQRPFISDERIISRYVYDVFDPNTGQFVVHTDGPYLYDRVTGIGNDLDPSFASEAEFRNQALVETADPFMLVADRDGPVHWFRVPGGWPATGFDFTPPFSPSLGSTPRLAATPPQSAVGLHPSAGGAAWMYVYEIFDSLEVSVDPGTGFLTSSLTTAYGPSTGGWIAYSTSLGWDLYPANGTHTFYAWYADASGNITDPGVRSGSTNLPQTLFLDADGYWGVWLYANAGETFTIGASGTTGDIDIFHWNPPGSGYCDNWANTYSNDSLTFTAAETGYHLVLLHNYPGAGAFDGTLTASAGAKAAGFPARSTDKTPPISNIDPYPEDPPPFSESPLVHLIFGDGFESGDVSAW